MARVKGASIADQAAHRIYDENVLPRNHGGRCVRCGAELITAYHEERLYSVRCKKCETVALVKARNPYQAEANVGIVPRPAEEYHEDYGDVLWWHFPIEEPPEVGTPDTYDRYGRPVVTEYHTHWTPIPIPGEPTREG
jgi:DNA-directed RNA polymerase subunit RPC12/RpoP